MCILVRVFFFSIRSFSFSVLNEMEEKKSQLKHSFYREIANKQSKMFQCALKMFEALKKSNNIKKIKFSIIVFTLIDFLLRF